MPTAIELARMRATSAVKAMPDLATISRVPDGTDADAAPGFGEGDPPPPSDDYGGTSGSANQVAPVTSLTNIPCRIGPASGQDLIKADGVRVDARLTIYFPFGTDVRETDQIEIRNEFFTVDGPVVSPGYEIETAVLVVRL
jgi:hypothetical protein